jgi:hypothetical protein
MPMRRRTFLTAAAASGAGAAFLGSQTAQAAHATAAGAARAQSTLLIDVSAPIRPVSRVANGCLYGLALPDRPPVDLILPLKLNTLRQPPPNHEHYPNGETELVGDPLDIGANALEAGAVIQVDMADTFDGFPYYWEGWDDWLGRVDRMIADLQARPDLTNIASWEIWNEPDWTWHADAGDWFEGWARTYERIRASDASTPILGPSYSYWDVGMMRDFLRAAQASGTVPEEVSWHELRGWQGVDAHIREFRALEQELGIGPLPISINEYASTEEIDVPSTVNHYVAQFEREGVRDAERAFWFEAGTLNGLLYNNQPTASFWMYQWYAEQTGDIVGVTPTEYNDAVAAYDAEAQVVSIVFAGEAGDNTIQVNGLADAFGSSVTATLEYTPGSGRETVVDAPTEVSTETYDVADGSVAVPVAGQDSQGAYRLLLTPA